MNDHRGGKGGRRDSQAGLQRHGSGHNLRSGSEVKNDLAAFGLKIAGASQPPPPPGPPSDPPSPNHQRNRQPVPPQQQPTPPQAPPPQQQQPQPPQQQQQQTGGFHVSSILPSHFPATPPTGAAVQQAGQEWGNSPSTPSGNTSTASVAGSTPGMRMMNGIPTDSPSPSDGRAVRTPQGVPQAQYVMLAPAGYKGNGYGGYPMAALRGMAIGSPVMVSSSPSSLTPTATAFMRPIQLHQSHQLQHHMRQSSPPSSPSVVAPPENPHPVQLAALSPVTSSPTQVAPRPMQQGHIQIQQFNRWQAPPVAKQPEAAVQEMQPVNPPVANPPSVAPKINGTAHSKVVPLRINEIPVPAHVFPSQEMARPTGEPLKAAYEKARVKELLPFFDRSVLNNGATA
eukprot:Sspe_Gene.41517::Locus_20077_Transcript_1_1_Confidence_1.000_Length_1353::g.41517::m.41517